MSVWNRQDLLSSAILASRPRFAPTPCCALVKGTLLCNVASDFDLWTGLCGEILEIFHDIRYLTSCMTTRNNRIEESGWMAFGSVTTAGMMAFSNERSFIEHRLLTLREIIKPRAAMQHEDYLLESCRIAALIYINCVLRKYSPNSTVLKNLKAQLILTIQDWEKSGLGTTSWPLPSSLTWILFIGGILSLNSLEETWFAERIARSMRSAGLKTWIDVEGLLVRMIWVDKLRTSACMRLWQKVEEVRQREMDEKSLCFGLCSRLPLSSVENL